MRKWAGKVKEKARLLRKSGLSYGDISSQLKIAKSTLHSWIYDLKRPGYITEEDRKIHLAKIRKLAAIAHRKHRLDRLERIKQRVGNEVKLYSFENKDYLTSLVSMLYWAEGSKGRGTLDFANTDPKLALLYLTLLRKTCKIDESRLRVRLHLHYYHSIKETRKFWSQLLGISESQFGKIYIKPRSKTKKFRRNFAGICFIRYHSDELRFEILERAKMIADMLVPVAQLD